MIIRDIDCGTKNHIVVKAFKDGNELIEPLNERVVGRSLVEDVIHPETGEILARPNQLVTTKQAMRIEESGIKKVKIRSVLTCEAERGVCSKCYGINLANRQPVNVGEAVGIIAAQSIGEPGTQLTMRTFHSGGVAGADITQGLPRVEELFEARKPKGLAVIAEINGQVSFKETRKKKEVIVTGDNGETTSAQIIFGSRLKVADGDFVEAGQEITEGSINPHDILRIVGLEGVQEYIIKEVQRVYRLQGVDINDKHIEIIIKQMISKIRIDESGDTELLPGSVISMKEFTKTNLECVEAGLEEATGTRVMLGITKASLATESFLSAASFQETTRVLTEAAIKGKEDRLVGLKENVIIGKLIPAGTGMKRYKDVQIHSLNDEIEVNEEEIF